MFSNNIKIDLSETNFFTDDYSAIKTECFLQSISLSESVCFPAISGVSKLNMVEIAPTSTSQTVQLPYLNCFTDQSIHSESDTSDLPNCPDDHNRWAFLEFCRADLGDVRRKQRLIQLASQRCASPNASIVQSCGSSSAAKAAYRFYDNDAIEPKSILASHQQATVERMSSKSLVLAVQDTTELDYSHHPATEGLGTLHHSQQKGLLAHTTLAVTPERVPLGIIQQQVWSRPEAEFGKKHQRKERPISDKESYKWLKSLQATAQLQQQLENTLLVSVGDREADVYELFFEAQQLSQDILVRASWNRCVDHKEKYLFLQMQSHPVAGALTITVPRQQKQEQREATLTIRHALVRLRPPQRPKGNKLPSVTVYAVLALEEQAPPSVKPIEWLLLTSVPIYHFDDASQRIAWYTCRWVIEIYHKVLKSGCRVEQRQFENAPRIGRYLAVDSVVAWRVDLITMLGRELPEMPCDAILAAHEWQALYCFIHQTNTPPLKPPTLAEATVWIAQMGGFLARKADGQPGITVIWRGWQRLQDVAKAFKLFNINNS
jgi:hypothetical protein